MNFKMAMAVLLLNLLGTTTEATIYLGFSDPQTGDKAMAVITSGPIDKEDKIVSAQKQSGLIGWSGGGRVSPLADKMIFKMMDEKESAEAIEAAVEAKYPNQYYRLLFITPSGEIGSLVSKNGCPDLECGKQEEMDFVVIGGGLENQVLLKTKDEFYLLKDQSEKQTACKMLEILNYIVKIGGEKKQFTSAQIIVDSPKRDQLLRANSFKGIFKTSEKKIIQNLFDDLAISGVNCSPF